MMSIKVARLRALLFRCLAPSGKNKDFSLNFLEKSKVGVLKATLKYIRRTLTSVSEDKRAKRGNVVRVFLHVLGCSFLVTSHVTF